MPSLKEIKGRIASVNSTRKITSAMKMVASSKLHHAQVAIQNMLPYETMLEHMNLWYMVNTELVTDDSGAKVRVPNRLIYGRAVPTEEARKEKNPKTRKLKYIDEEKSKALQVIRGYMVSRPSDYYNQEFERRLKQSGNKDEQGNEIPDEDGRTFDEW